jgi:hypothetical protein
MRLSRKQLDAPSFLPGAPSAGARRAGKITAAAEKITPCTDKLSRAGRAKSSVGRVHLLGAPSKKLGRWGKFLGGPSILLGRPRFFLGGPGKSLGEWVWLPDSSTARRGGGVAIPRVRMDGSGLDMKRPGA